MASKIMTRSPLKETEKRGDKIFSSRAKKITFHDKELVAHDLIL
jgi:hypothetical protein